MTDSISRRLFGRALYIVPLYMITAAGHAANGLALWTPAWWGTPGWWLLQLAIGVALSAVFALGLSWLARRQDEDITLRPFRPRGLLVTSVGSLIVAASVIGAFEATVTAWMSFGGIFVTAVGIAVFVAEQVGPVETVAGTD